MTLSDRGDDAPVVQQQVFAEVTEASVGRVANYNMVVRQKLTPVATNMLPGIVTSVSSGLLGQGAEAYSVANVAVRVARGAMPFYRDLETGCKGPDVQQAQQLLADLGYNQPVTGEWAEITTANMRAWQRQLGEPETGRIPLGTLAAVPQLPASITVDDGIAVGALATPGIPGLKAFMGNPEFVLPLTSEQARNLPPAATVQINFEGHTWSGVVAKSQQLDVGQTDLIFAAPDGGAVCGDQCGLLPAAESTSLPSSVQLVPPVSGPAVPATAVRTGADGDNYVLLPDGTKAPVKVLASDRGLAIVEGLSVGQQIVLLEAK